MEDVVIEILDSEMVSVMPFDKEVGEIIGDCIEVTTRRQAYDEYNVIGEMYDGEVRVSDEECEIEDYSEYFPEDCGDE